MRIAINTIPSKFVCVRKLLKGCSLSWIAYTITRIRIVIPTICIGSFALWIVVIVWSCRCYTINCTIFGWLPYDRCTPFVLIPIVLLSIPHIIISIKVKNFKVYLHVIDVILSISKRLKLLSYNSRYVGCFIINVELNGKFVCTWLNNHKCTIVSYTCTCVIYGETIIWISTT